MTRAWLLVIAAACGYEAATPMDAAIDAPSGCTARFTGNYIETSTADANCAHLTPALTLSIPTAALAAPLDVKIDLGATPLPGTYSSALVTSWSAIALQRIGNGGCEYSAGSHAIPSGSFVLELGATDGAVPHGTLTILQYVLTLPGTDCGDVDTETAVLEF